MKYVILSSEEMVLKFCKLYKGSLVPEQTQAQDPGQAKKRQVHERKASVFILASLQ